MKTEVFRRHTLDRISSKNNFLPKLIIVSSLLLTGFQLQAEPVMHPAIPILDEQGDHVLDNDTAYSARETCGGCHDYDSITSAFHFEMGSKEARDDYGKNHGVSTLVSPGYFGGYNCMGGSNPDTLANKINASEADFKDKGVAGWVQRCSGCHTGGGWMEKDRNGVRYDKTDPATVAHLDGDYFNRGTDENNTATGDTSIAQWDWKKSGVVEADCFLCHADFSALIKTDPETEGNSDDAFDHADDLRNDMLIDGGHFNYAGTAILEFINLNNTADPENDKTLLNFDRTAAADDADHMAPSYTLNLDEDGKPILHWNEDAFENGKVEIPMLRFPENENCMNCHSTSNSRRGFYGFGEDAEAVYDEEGMLEEDYKDDVHKGLEWTENGETRPIENCNACHSRNYYNSLANTNNVDLDANHNFLKGNSDMDLRNDLDYSPNTLSCEYCHDTAEEPAIPSGQDSMLNAHLEIWKANGDMFGYTADSLSRVTQTHLDVVTCQACHITDKVARGRSMPIMFRYRQEEGGKLKIVPYAQRDRYYWKDKNTDTILNKTERNSVFELRGADDSMPGMPTDEMYGVIVDPETGAELAEVSARVSHGSIRFGDPEDYAGFLALRNAYNKVFKMKGIDDANAVMVLTESNQYIMNHNTRPGPESLQCEDCHAKKQNGSFSALIAEDSVLGTTNSLEIFTLPDARLISEGIVELDKDYMKADDNGVISINVSDVLYSTRLNPSLSILNADIASEMSGMVNRYSLAEAASLAGISNPEHINILAQSGDELFIFTPVYGDPAIRKVALMPMVNSQTELVFPTYMFRIALADNDAVNAAANAGFGGLNAPVFTLQATDTNGDDVSSFGNANVLVKLPYTGSETSVENIRLITSADGKTWSGVDAASILLLNPQTDSEDGYLAFNTSHFSYYTVTTGDETNTSAADDASPSGGGVLSPWSLVLLAGFYGWSLKARKRK